VKPAVRNALGGIAVLLLATLFVRLGLWQLDRLHERRVRNAAWNAALAMPPLPLDSGRLADVARRPAGYVNRRVRVLGTYDPAGELLLRGRSMDGRPGVHVVTPLNVAGAPWTVLVNRGWAYAPDAANPARPIPAEVGPRTVEGVLQLVPSAGDRGIPSYSAVRPRDPGTRARGFDRLVTYRHLDLASLRGHFARPLLPLYVQQLPGPDSAAGTATLRRVPLPPLDEGPHFSYAVQWFSFALIAVVGYLVLVFRRREPPRP
jgi:surfeit locus 1 family protein